MSRTRAMLIAVAGIVLGWIEFDMFLYDEGYFHIVCRSEYRKKLARLPDRQNSECSNDDKQNRGRHE